MGERDKLPIRIERDRMRWKEPALLTFLQQSRLFLYDSKNKPPALQGEGSSLDQRNSCAKINVGLQTTNKKHRRSKEWTQIV